MRGIHSQWSDHNRLSGGGREPAVQNPFLQPGARMAHPGKGSQEFFIPIDRNPLKSPDSKK
jgi:hypothetical protein